MLSMGLPIMGRLNESCPKVVSSPWVDFRRRTKKTRQLNRATEPKTPPTIKGTLLEVDVGSGLAGPTSAREDGSGEGVVEKVKLAEGMAKDNGPLVELPRLVDVEPFAGVTPTPTAGVG